MFIKKSQLPIAIIMFLALIFFSILFFSQSNYEFIIYVGVIVFFLLLILFTNKKVEYSNVVLGGLTLWAILHMSGGGFYPGGTRLYEIILIPISNTYQIFRYDQFVHIVGFFVATLLSFSLIKPLLKDNIKRWTALSIVIVMAGLGFGALNEIVEFSATVFVAETGVGGYINTSLDLVADFIGAVLAMIFIRLRKIQ